MILFNLIGVLLILFIISWFWLAKGKSTVINEDVITIEVKDGVYSPNKITINRSNIQLNFIRKDASPCSEYVIFDGLDVHEQLPLNKPHRINLNNLKSGHYKFTCQMNMYQGELIVDVKDV